MGVLPCVSFKRHKPSGSVLFFLRQRLQQRASHPRGREVSRGLDGGPNSATIDYHSIRLRLGFTACGRGAAGEGGSCEGRVVRERVGVGEAGVFQTDASRRQSQKRSHGRNGKPEIER